MSYEKTMVISTFTGVWHILDQTFVQGHVFFLLEKDGNQIVVDKQGEPVLSNLSLRKTFDDHLRVLLEQELMPVEKMPDDSISVKEMKEYGYFWGGMLPMRKEAALRVFRSDCTIYRLYEDDTEAMIECEDDIEANASRGGIFGVEKVNWISFLNKKEDKPPIDVAEAHLAWLNSRPYRQELEALLQNAALHAFRRSGLQSEERIRALVDKIIELVDTSDREVIEQSRPSCYTPEPDNPYPLCVGKDGMPCNTCSLWASLSDSRDP